MRRLNTASTLRELHARKVATLAQLTESTGLSRRTVELILDELIAEGRASETAPSAGARGVGRPARTFAFNPQHAYAMAIQIAQDSVNVLVCDLYGTSLGSWSEPTTARTDRAERLQRVRDAVNAMYRTLDVGASKIASVTVSTMGVVDDGGVVELKGATESVGPDVADWSGFSIAAELGQLFDCDVVVENDAKLAAVGEGWRGGAQDAEDFVYVLAEGRRVGVGVVIGGRLYRGLHGQAGEIFWAQPVFGLGEALDANPLLALAEPRTDDGHRALELVQLARRGDPGAVGAVRDLASQLAPGLHGIACLLSPQVLIVGGAFSEIGSVLIDALVDEFGQRTSPDTRIALSELGQRAVLLGAMRSSLDRIEEQMFSAS
jgi:predicted NBD/HSP70 family sugar kinase